MPELMHVDDVAKIRVFGPPQALDGLSTPPDTIQGRIAPEELVLLGRPGTAAALAARLEAELAAHGPRALVVDHTDGWSCFALVGDGLGEVFARLTHVPLPAAGAEPVFVMGRVCDVAAKVFVRGGRIDILTGAEASDHVRHRLEEAVARVEQRSVVPGGDDTLVREQAVTR